MVEKEILNKSIKVSEKTYKKLNNYRIADGETFNSVIKRLLDNKINGKCEGYLPDLWEYKQWMK